MQSQREHAASRGVPSLTPLAHGVLRSPRTFTAFAPVCESLFTHPVPQPPSCASQIVLALLAAGSAHGATLAAPKVKSTLKLRGGLDSKQVLLANAAGLAAFGSEFGSALVGSKCVHTPRRYSPPRRRLRRDCARYPQVGFGPLLGLRADGGLAAAVRGVWDRPPDPRLRDV